MHIHVKIDTICIHFSYKQKNIKGNLWHYHWENNTKFLEAKSLIKGVKGEII